MNVVLIQTDCKSPFKSRLKGLPPSPTRPLEVHGHLNVGGTVLVVEQFDHEFIESRILEGSSVLAGSSNWTRGGSSENVEILLALDDSTSVAAFQSIFERLGH